MPTDQKKVVIARPEWARYWRSFVIFPRNPLLCCLCRNPIKRKQLALKKGENLYCITCARSLYEALRQDLQELETRVFKESLGLGHRLSSFYPAHFEDAESGVFVANCEYCQKAVCYNVIDMVRDWDRAHDHAIILFDPIGFPIKHQCPRRG